MKSPKEIQDEKQQVQDEQEKRNGGEGGGGGDPQPPPPPPKVASKSKSNALRKLEMDKAIPRGFLIPFPLHRCGWSPEGGAKRWCILNLVLVGIAIIISLANLVLVMSKSHDPEKHKAFMAFHPGYYWKCKRSLLTFDVASTFVGEMVYLVACIFLLSSVLFKQTSTKIILAKLYLYISILFPLGYLPRLFLLSNAPCKDPNAITNFGLIIVLFTLYLLLVLWLVVGNKLVKSYILWLRNPNAEEFYRDDDSEIIDIEEGHEPKQYRRLSNHLKKERNIFEVIIERKVGFKSKASSIPQSSKSSKVAVKPKESPVPQSSKPSKAAVPSVQLKFKQSQTSLIEEIPSTAPTTRPLNPKKKEEDEKKKKEEEDKKKKIGLFGKIMGGLKNVTKKK